MELESMEGLAWAVTAWGLDSMRVQKIWKVHALKERWEAQSLNFIYSSVFARSGLLFTESTPQ